MDVVRLTELLSQVQALLAEAVPDEVKAPEWAYKPINEKTAILAGWLGLEGVAPHEVDTEHGRFQAYPAQAGPDYGWIMRGCKNVRAKAWNALDLTGPWGVNPALGADDPELNRIRSYGGNLRSDPKRWPEPYRLAFIVSHPDFEWDGVTKPDSLSYFTLD